MSKLKVAILGASGAVGQRFIQLLEHHPWFEVGEVVGKTSAGKRYGEATHWILNGSPPDKVAKMVVKPLGEELDSPLVFSALPKEAALEIEEPLAAKGHVVATNASAHRMGADIPLLLPEVNADHVGLIDVQRKNRGWSTGALVANSNCTVMPVVMSLAPLMPFDVDKVLMVSEQAVSGAGYPGVPSLDIIDNIVPYVPGDEDKMEAESRKMLGTFDSGEIVMASFDASATCTRVPVVDGHVVIISVSLRANPSLGDVIAAWQEYRAVDVVAQLPSSPQPLLRYIPQIDRPQPRRDRDAGNGMATSIGRLRMCPVLGYKFVTLSHNTIRGAAGSSILNAELLAVKGYISGFSV
ncbi:MAG: aspartate-semialdehyde dehydrogenase [Anaerolineae bacterium]